MNCPNCGAEDQTGKFCASCGAALNVTCEACGADVPAGATYCTACGEPVAESAGEGSLVAPGIIAAIALVLVVVLVVLFLPGDSGPARPAAGGGMDAPFMGAGSGSGGGAPGTGGLSSDMRTNADRLFNRIMMAAENGNQAEVDQFMPMAIQAYGMVDNLDDDGLFHLGMLHLTAGSYEEAQATAERILAGSPDHLLGLAVAAQAEAAAGDTAAAASYWERYLDAYDAEAGKPLPAYVDHQPVLTTYLEMAREAAGSR